MIRCRDIHKRFGTLEVLRGIDLDIAQGEVAAIVGPSGAGKTTLLQILGTLSPPDGGTDEIAGNTFGSLRAGDVVRPRHLRTGVWVRCHPTSPDVPAVGQVEV